MNRRQFLTALGGVGAVGVGVVGPATAREPPVIELWNTYFDPIGLSVDRGTTVRFEHREGTHSATAYEERVPAEATPFDTGIFSEGWFEFTFDVPGTYDYYCVPHQSAMVGRIVVGEPGGPAESGAIPNGSVPDSERIVADRTVSVAEFEDGSTDSGGMMGGMGHGHGDDGGMMDGMGHGHGDDGGMMDGMGHGHGDDGGMMDGMGHGEGGGMMGGMGHGHGDGDGMMGGMGHGHGDGAGWVSLVPLGLLSALGLAAGAIYTVTRRTEPGDLEESSRMASLRTRYARGEIDDAEFERRRARIERTRDRVDR